MDNVKQINDSLSIAGQVTPQQLQQAKEEGYQSILNLRAPEEEGFWQNESQEAEALGLQYVNIPVKMNAINDDLTTQVLQEIDSLPKPALIHCGSAMRAGAMTMMHLAIQQNMTPQEAFENAGQMGFDCSAHPQMKQYFEQYVSSHT